MWNEQLINYGVPVIERRRQHVAELSEIILEKNMLSNPGAMADYYRTHYPDSWADAKKQQALK